MGGSTKERGRSERRRASPDMHLNLNVRGMTRSATVAINERSAVLRAQGRQIYRLGLGQSPFPVPEQVVEALRRHAHEKDYLPVEGLPALREAIADYTRRTVSIDRDGADVLVGPGSKELLFLLQLVYYGDLVVPTPAWVSYVPQARMLGRSVQLIPTERRLGWRMEPEELERVCREDTGRPRILILNYPSNPTGSSYTTDELRQLATVARQNRVVLLSDEIYGQTHHRGQHVSIARFYPEGTIISSGLSKWCGAGGWRLGYFIFPPELRWLLSAMAVAASETYTSTSAPIQHAAVTAFRGSAELTDYLHRSRRILGALGRWSQKRLQTAGLDCLRPVGAFYLFPGFEALRGALAARGIHDSPQLSERFLDDTGVAILPGSVFGRSPDELTARLAYVDFDGAAALEAARHAPSDAPIDDAFLRQHCSRVLEAMDRLCAWVAG